MNVAASSNLELAESIPGYEIERHLAQGGMARVYVAKQQSLARSVALKLLREFNDDTHRQRFFNESKTIAALNHRNIITIHDVGEFERQAFLSMELYEGGDLESRIKRGPLDCCTALEIAASIGEALGFAHDHGVVHRDVKPANILFHKDGTPVLTDFGIATDVAMDPNLTAVGTAVGTPTYASPEQVQGKRADGRSDIYSLGIVLYAMLVGRPPFNEASAVETMAAHVNLPAPNLPDEFCSIQPVLDRMIAKCAEDRFGTAQEMVVAIREIQVDLQSTDHRPDSPLRELFRDLDSTIVDARDFVSDAIANRNVQIGGTIVVVCAVIWWGISLFSVPDPVDLMIERAEHAVSEDKLAYPLKGSALHYYREALLLDAENEGAMDGLHDIAETYADRAEQDLVASNFPSAKFNIDRGLQAEPTNQRLRQLDHETDKLRKLPEKVIRGIKSLFD